MLYKNAYKATCSNLSYEFSKKLGVYCDVYNLLNQPQSYHYAIPQHLYQYTVNGMIINLGVRGHF